MHAHPEILAKLATLASEIQHGKPGSSPVPGRLGNGSDAAPAVLTDAADLRRRLAEWLTSGDITGWILTVDALAVLEPGAAPPPDDVALAAELHQKDDDRSLNLSHTPKGWIWEELQLLPENPETASFIEEYSCFVNTPSMHRNSEESLPSRMARYQVEWRLTPSPDNGSTAFRPARSRFIGWKSTPA